MTGGDARKSTQGYRSKAGIRSGRIHVVRQRETIRPHDVLATDARLGGPLTRSAILCSHPVTQVNFRPINLADRHLPTIARGREVPNGVPVVVLNAQPTKEAGVTINFHATIQARVVGIQVLRLA